MERTSPTPMTNASKYSVIAMDKISASRHQARKNFDEEALKKLAESVKMEGLIQPITVRLVSSPKSQVPSPDQGHETRDPGPLYELISGERRFRAAKLLGWTEIEAKVIQPVSEGEAAAKGLIENLQREDLNPMDEAEGYQNLLDLKDAHWSQVQIARAVGKPESRISESLRLIGLPGEVKELLRYRKIDLGHGVEIARLNSPKSKKRLAQKVVQKGLTVMQTRAIVDKKLGKTKEPGNRDGDRDRVLDSGSSPSPSRSPIPDLLASVWQPLLKDPSVLPHGIWSVTLDKEGRHFHVTVPPEMERSELKHWFMVLAQAMGDTSQEEAQVKSLEDQATQLSSGSHLVVNKEVFSGIRVPKTPQERAELEALAEKGLPFAYEWIFGKDSPVAQAVQGMRWENGGYPDSKTGLAAVLADAQNLLKIANGGK